MRFISVSLLLVLLLPLIQSAKAEYHKIILSQNGHITSMHLYAFSIDDYEIKVIDNGPKRLKPIHPYLAKAMEDIGAVAGVNAGFFIPRTFQPDGLMIAEGKRYGKFDPNTWMRGIFQIKAGTPEILSKKNFETSDEVTDFIQASPIFILDGKKLGGFGGGKVRTKRTFIATDDKGKWIIGVCESASLGEMPKLLHHDKMKEVIGISTALNLDGGRSTGMWVDLKGKDLNIQEGWPVRNYIAILPKN